MTQSTKPGDDDENAWNDRHLQHAYLWLTTNESSPYCGSPAMLLTAMRIDRAYWHDFRRSFNRGDLTRYRFSVRCQLTKSLQRVLAGEFEPRVIKRNRLGRVTAYEVRPAASPQPLPCPPFYRGTIGITTKGLKISLRRTDASLAPRHDPEGRARLLSPFQKC
jgi:hypothetical protein